MKHFLPIFLILSLATSAFAQDGADRTEVDPEVMNAILDASKASADPNKDPLEGVVTETPVKQRAKEAAKQLRQQGNEVTAPKTEVKKEVKKPVANVISKEEEELLKMWEKEQTKTKQEEAQPATAKSTRKPIYIPAPVEEADHDGVLLERDSRISKEDR